MKWEAKLLTFFSYFSVKCWEHITLRYICLALIPSVHCDIGLWHWLSLIKIQWWRYVVWNQEVIFNLDVDCCTFAVHTMRYILFWFEDVRRRRMFSDSGLCFCVCYVVQTLIHSVFQTIVLNWQFGACGHFCWVSFGVLWWCSFSVYVFRSVSSCGVCPGERGIVACTLAPWSSDDRFCRQLETYLDHGSWRWHWPVVAVRFKYRHTVPTGVKVKLHAWKLSSFLSVFVHLWTNQ